VILLIDNYDSFTYNLYQYLAELAGEVDVKRNDSISVDEIESSGYSAIVISPGPGEPQRAGITLKVIGACGSHFPMLGICLGHQAIGHAFGGRVVRAPQPIHGKASAIRHNGQGLFAGIESPMAVGRYHSLIVEHDSLPRELHITAETDDGIIMALEHRTLPLYGVQFHPESILTPDGKQLLRNFVALANAHCSGLSRSARR
jgi:anthranilate synthase component II